VIKQSSRAKKINASTGKLGTHFMYPEYPTKSKQKSPTDRRSWFLVFNFIDQLPLKNVQYFPVYHIVPNFDSIEVNESIQEGRSFK